MGKNLRQKKACSPIQNQPGFMWGLFNILKHNHWRYIKKRLPHTKLVGRRHPLGTRNEENNTKPSTNKTEDNIYVDSAQKPTKPNSQEKLKKHRSEEKPKKHKLEEKKRKTNSEIKKSVKALMKALVLEDKSKRNNRHNRSSTYPAVQSNSIEKESPRHLESSDENSSDADHTDQVFNQAGDVSPAIGSLNPLFLMSEESSSSESDECVAEDTVDDAVAEEKHLNRKRKKKKRDEKAWYDSDSIHNREILENDDDTSPRRSKACIDALNLIHMNRNFLLRVLQDPDSPLARHFRKEQAFSSKTMLTKAGSFPVPASPPKTDSRTEDHNAFIAESNKKLLAPFAAAEHELDGIHKLNDTMEKFADEDSSGVGYTRKWGKNQVVVKRFKDLRQKIRHVVNENKNEKQRITMDAVLDKLPRKHGFSKDLRQDSFNQLKGHTVSRSRTEGSRLKQMRRTSSLGGSLDRYLQLYECSFQREGKNKMSERSQGEVEEQVLPSRRAPKTLGRILSLPEMELHSSKIEDSPEDEQEKDDMEIPKASLDQLDGSREREEALKREVDDTEKESSAIDQDRLKVTFASTNEGKAEREIDDDELVLDTELLQDEATENATRSSDELSEDSPCFTRTVPLNEEAVEEEDLESQHDHVGTYTESSINKELESIGIAINDDDDDDVEAQERERFNYVRDILEISGFNTTESLSTWHSDYQPLDPLVYEEVTTGCMLQDPDCSGNDHDGGNCYHLLLFDLINEVLIQIYERSYHYSPMPLSSLCRIHPMPVGYSVLNDVWLRINGYLRCKQRDGQPLDHHLSMDLSKGDGWMNLQFDSECVGLEVDDLIFDQLLEEVLLMD